MTANTTEELILKAMPLVTAQDVEESGSFENALIQKAWSLDELTAKAPGSPKASPTSHATTTPTTRTSRCSPGSFTACS